MITLAPRSMKMHASAAALALSTAACAVTEPPPPKPPPVVPEVDPPDHPVPEGDGRVTVDAVDGPAKVARVVDRTTIEPSPALGYAYGARARWAPPLLEQTRTELLCTTPCVLDLPRGAHTLVFTSLDDPTRTSEGDVTVSKQPAFVRHAIGRNQPPSSAYVAGVLTAAMGGGLTTMGTIMTVIGAVASSSRVSTDTTTSTTASSSTRGDPKVFVAAGAVTLGIGVALLTTGVVLAVKGRPVHQPGATTEWTASR